MLFSPKSTFRPTLSARAVTGMQASLMFRLSVENEDGINIGKFINGTTELPQANGIRRASSRRDEETYIFIAPTRQILSPHPRVSAMRSNSGVRKIITLAYSQSNTQKNKSGMKRAAANPKSSLSLSYILFVPHADVALAQQHQLALLNSFSWSMRWLYSARCILRGIRNSFLCPQSQSYTAVSLCPMQSYFCAPCSSKTSRPVYSVSTWLDWVMINLVAPGRREQVNRWSSRV